MRKILSSSIAILAAVAPFCVHAENSVDRGAVLADTCLGCHGIDGYRTVYPSYHVPKLGGQHEAYLVAALEGYRNHTRSHPTMIAQASSLSDADIKAVAAFFASRGDLQQGEAKSGPAIRRGEKKAAVCTACHGPAGVSTMPNWPVLAGQHSDYLQQAIGQYQAGKRTDPVMAGQAGALSRQDVEDLAAYFAAQPGLFTPRK